MASRILCIGTQVALYETSRSRDSASALLPFTSFIAMAMAARYMRRGSLWEAKSVPEVMLKSF